jgi:ribonuclease HI
VREVLLQVDGTPGFPARGIAGLGLVVRNERGLLLRTRCMRAPAATCTEAEYQALIAGLALVLRDFPGARVRCLSDSRVVVDQLCGRAAVRAGPLQPLYTAARATLARFAPHSVAISAIPRNLNRLADALAWEALGGRGALLRYVASNIADSR